MMLPPVMPNYKKQISSTFHSSHFFINNQHSRYLPIKYIRFTKANNNTTSSASSTSSHILTHTYSKKTSNLKTS